MSMTEQIGWDNANTLYLSIVGGSMVQKVEEWTPGAKRREYETSDGNKGVKFEIHHKNLTGKITGLEFKDGEFGEQFILTLWNWDEQAKLHLNTDSKYFTAFAKKLPNINLEKEITINSFDFTSSEWKRLTGMDIKQEGLKVDDFYWDGKKSLNGIPEVSKEDAKWFDKDDWKLHFISVKKFLKKEVQKVVLPISDSQPLEINEAEDVFE